MEHSRRNALSASQSDNHLEVDGVRLAVSRFGEGLPLICLHATGHGGGDYALLIERLRDKPFEVIAVDWPGHGRSGPDRPLQAASASRYARLVEGLVPIVAPDKKVVLLGNSIGGAAAIRYAADHPEQIAALVICDAGGLAPIDRLAKSFIWGMVKFFGAGARGARWFKSAFAVYYSAILSARPAREQRQRIVNSIEETALLVQQAWQSFADPAEDLIPAVKALRMPVLFAWSRSDPVVSFNRSRAAIASAPRGTVQMFKGGHSAFLEDPDAFAEALINFVRKEGLESGLTTNK